MFDGKDTSGWKNPYEWGEVTIEGDEIHLKADKKFFLVTEKEYGDGEFEGQVVGATNLMNGCGRAGDNWGRPLR